MEKTIAVLPFVNMSDDPTQAYFSDGITEEIINALAHIEGLKVTSRTSSFYFKEKQLPLPEIARQLQVSIILEGSVRLAGDMMRITAQLIQAAEDFHFWSERWDRPRANLLQIQDEISLLIADKLREQLGHFDLAERLKPLPTESSTAFEWALQARYHFNKWNATDAKQAISCYEAALKLDPNYAEAMVGLADSYSFLGTTGFLPYAEAWEKSARLTHEAMAIDPRSASAYYQLSNIAFFTDCDFERALQHAEKALACNSNYAEAHQFLAFLYLLGHQHDAARLQLEEARKLDPLSQETLFYLAYYHYWTGEYEAALIALDACLEHNPHNIPAITVKSYCLLMLNRPDEALELHARMPLDISVKADKLGLAYLAQICRQDASAQQSALQALEEEAAGPEGFRARSYLFIGYGMTRQFDAAFAWIEQAYAAKEALLRIHFDAPLVRGLREDARFPVWQARLFPFAHPQQNSPKKALIPSEKARHLQEQLLAFMREEKPHLDSNLSLRSLAEQLSLHPNHLSWLLNEFLGQNFNAFINHYRVNTFKELVQRKQYSHLSLVGLAFESGFNSKTVFNTYFKKETGMTPTQFMKATG